jgi:hypothetical protein
MKIVSKLAAMVALSFGVAVAAPVSAPAADGAHPFHKPAVQTHRVAYAGLTSYATAFAPSRVVAPVVPAPETDGLSRNLDDCVTYGCIGSN